MVGGRWKSQDRKFVPLSPYDREPLNSKIIKSFVPYLRSRYVFFEFQDSLLHSLERAAPGIGLHVNAQKTEFMCFNQKGDISTLDGTSLKLVDKFTYLGSSVSSTEKDIDTRLTKAWTAIDRLTIIWKSNLTDKMKRSFFQAAVV